MIILPLSILYTNEYTTTIPPREPMRTEILLDLTMTCIRQDALDANDQLKPYSAAGPYGLSSKIF